MFTNWSIKRDLLQDMIIRFWVILYSYKYQYTCKKDDWNVSNLTQIS